MDKFLGIYEFLAFAPAYKCHITSVDYVWGVVFVPQTPQRSLSLVPQARAGVSIQGSSLVRRAARSPACSNEERDFLARLHAFMKSRQTPINRVPTIGFKEC